MAGNIKKNVILTHSPETDDWGFCRVLSQSVGLPFHVEYMSIGSGGNRLRNLWCYVVFPLLVFLRRRRYDVIVTPQQFYGLLLAFYCRLFHVRKTFWLVVISLIYLPKQGVIGKVYERFMKYITGSPYIDLYIVRSSRELQTYQQQLGIAPDKLRLVPLGLGGNFEAPHDATMQERKYILSVGRSNRDYAFLIDTLEDSDYNVDIICDTCTLTPRNPRIKVHRDIFATTPLWVKNCYCVVIPLRDTQVSSGQLVLLHAMMEGKPVIVTDADAVRDYIEPGVTGLTIHNTRQELLEALDRLYHDTELYDRLATAARASFTKKFSAEREVERIGEEVKTIL